MRIADAFFTNRCRNSCATRNLPENANDYFNDDVEVVAPDNPLGAKDALV